RAAQAFNCRSNAAYAALLRLLGRFRRTRHTPGVVFLLGFGNLIEGGLVGLLVSLGFLLRLLLGFVMRPLARHLGLCPQCRHRAMRRKAQIGRRASGPNSTPSPASRAARRPIA